MSKKEKFQAFKKDLVEKNEQTYGKEIREKYGDETIDESNRRILNLSEEDYQEMMRIGEEIATLLEDAVQKEERPEGDIGKKIAELHKKWLGYTWNFYSEEAHRGLAEMYVADERFKAYYDRQVAGCAQFLRDAIHAWCR